MPMFHLAQFAEDSFAFRIFLPFGKGGVHRRAVHLQRPVVLQRFNQPLIVFLLNGVHLRFIGSSHFLRSARSVNRITSTPGRWMIARIEDIGGRAGWPVGWRGWGTEAG